jgi:hypothetical protein
MDEICKEVQWCVCVCAVDYCGSGQRLLAVFYEGDDELSNSIKCGGWGEVLTV